MITSETASLLFNDVYKKPKEPGRVLFHRNTKNPLWKWV